METREIEQQDIVKHLMEEDGKLYVTFQGHAAYYSVPLSNPELCAAIREAQASSRVIIFTHDNQCRISKIR